MLLNSPVMQILVVALSMALTPYLAMAGEIMGATFGKNDAKVNAQLWQWYVWVEVCGWSGVGGGGAAV